jgi:hypothetical protein
MSGEKDCAIKRAIESLEVNQSKIENKIDGLTTIMNSINLNLAVSVKALEEQSRRMDTIEDSHKMEVIQSKAQINKIEESVDKVQSHVDSVNGGMKLIGVLSVIVAIITGVAQLKP